VQLRPCCILRAAARADNQVNAGQLMLVLSKRLADDPAEAVTLNTAAGGTNRHCQTETRPTLVVPVRSHTKESIAQPTPASISRIEVRLATQAAFRFGSIELVSKLIDGKFPDYTRVIPTGHKNKLQIGREALRQALLRAAILSNEKFRGVRWVLSDGSLKIVSSNAEQEEAHEEVEIKYSGDGLDIGFNVNYLLDVLNNVSGENIECAFGDASSSALISYPTEKDFRYVVMPMRI